MAVWSLLLQSGSEGSSFISRTARRFRVILIQCHNRTFVGGWVGERRTRRRPRGDSGLAGDTPVTHHAHSARVVSASDLRYDPGDRALVAWAGSYRWAWLSTSSCCR